MTKKELIQAVGKSVGKNPKVADVVNAIFAEIETAICLGDGVNIKNFGKWELRKRAARKCRNPRTGEEIAVPERHVVYFAPYKNLRLAE